MILLKKISVFAVLVMILTTGCSKKTLASAEVNYVSGNEGTIVMRSIGVGTNQQEAIADAEKRSINVILFRGLPESLQKIALIGTNESEEMDKHKDYFDTFYNKIRYRTFIMSSIPVSDFKRQSGGSKSLAVDVKVNLVALRKDLEQNNIIRKFGY
jgi:hypothetical protein